MAFYHLNHMFFDNPLDFEGVTLYQAGTMYCRADTMVPEHNQRHRFELTVVTDGQGVITTNGTDVAVSRQDIYISFPGDMHALRADFATPMQYDFLAFSVEYAPFLEALNALQADFKKAEMRVFRHEQVQTLVKNIINEISANNFYMSSTFICAAFKLLLVDIVRIYRNEMKRKTEFQLSNPQVLCHQLRHYVDTHIYTMQSLNELAALTGYSYSYLSTLFRKTTGETLLKYWQNRKTETAKQMLLSRDYTISKIAELLNYSSVYAFSKAFHACCGVSPRAFRKSNC